MRAPLHLLLGVGDRWLIDLISTVRNVFTDTLTCLPPSSDIVWILQPPQRDDHACWVDVEPQVGQVQIGSGRA